MQNRPALDASPHYAPFNLPADFPVSLSDYRQSDLPITRLHVHNCVELGYCHSGAGIFVIEGKVLPFSAGDVCVVTEHETHLAQSMAGTVSNWSFVLLDPARLVAPVAGAAAVGTSRLQGPEFRNVLHAAEFPAITGMVRQIIDEMRHRPAGYREAVRGLVLATLAQLQRLAPRQPGRAAQARRAARADALQRIAPALQHISAGHTGPLALPQLAAACHTSQRTLRRWFEVAMGMSPQRYLIDYRVKMAAALLRHGDRPITQIAMDVGFESVSSFNRHFRSLTNQSPREYRRRG